jgi:hypothetical protein
MKKTVSKSETAVADEYGRKSHVECGKSPERRIQQQVVKDLAQNRDNTDMNSPELGEKSCSKGTVRPRQHRRKHHRRKHSSREGATFEGERVSYLVGQCEAEAAHPSAGDGEERSVEEDDYVLRKLFKKSGETFTCKVCPLSLVSTTEELCESKSSGSFIEIEITAVGIRHTDHVASSVCRSWH